MKNNLDKWIEFLKPENLKGNLISCSLYIATFESFKDYIIEEVKFFFNTGFREDEFKFSSDYKTKVLNKNKSVLTATFLWLKDQGAIENSTIEEFELLRKYRNKLAHEMMELLFEGNLAELPENFSKLLEIRIKIEKWWTLNIEIPTNPSFDSSTKIKEEDIQTSSQIINKIIMDILTGDETTSNYYYKEFLRQKDLNSK